MAVLLRHLLALQYKNFLVSRRSLIVVCCQYFFALLGAFIFVIQFLFVVEPHEFLASKSYEEQAMPFSPNAGSTNAGAQIPLDCRAGWGEELLTSVLSPGYAGHGDTPENNLFLGTEVGAFLDSVRVNLPNSYTLLGLDAIAARHAAAAARPGLVPLAFPSTIGMSPQSDAARDLKSDLEWRFSALRGTPWSLGFDLLDVCPPVTPECSGLHLCLLERLERLALPGTNVSAACRSCEGIAPGGLRAHQLWPQLEQRISAALLAIADFNGGPGVCTNGGPSLLASMANFSLDAIDDVCAGARRLDEKVPWSFPAVPREATSVVAREGDAPGLGRQSASRNASSGGVARALQEGPEVTEEPDDKPPLARSTDLDMPTFDPSRPRLNVAMCAARTTACSCAELGKECAWVVHDNDGAEACEARRYLDGTYSVGASLVNSPSYDRDHGLAYWHSTPCWKCATQAGCKEQALWAGTRQLVRAARPTILLLSDQDALENHILEFGDKPPAWSSANDEDEKDDTEISDPAANSFVDEVGVRSWRWLCAAIHLDTSACIGGTGGDCEYTIRMPALEEADNGDVESVFPVRTSWYEYVHTSGLVTLQYIVDSSLLRSGLPGASSSPLRGLDARPWFQLMEFPESERLNIPTMRETIGSDDFNDGGNLSNIVVSTIILAYAVVSRALREKDEKLREGMRMMGMSDVSYYLSQLVYAITWSFVPSVGVAMIIYMSWSLHCDPANGCDIEGDQANTHFEMGTLLENSNGFWFFVLYWFGCVAQVALGLVIVPLVGRARTGRILVGIWLYLSSAVLLTGPRSVVAKALCSLIPSAALQLGMNRAMQLADIGMGLQTSTLGIKIDGYAFGTALYMLVIDIVLYMLMYMYLDQVAPYGSGHRPMYFLFTKDFWFEALGKGKRSGVVAPVETEATGLSGFAQDPTDQALNPAFEAASEAQENMTKSGRTLEVRGLRKQFKVQGASFNAVDDVDFSMFPGEIYVLLGHNGAGKSTAINCLTGVLRATAGSARLIGRDLWKALQTTEGRRTIGICPQHNVQWGELTCLEHGKISGCFRGFGWKEAKEASLAIFKQTGLADKVNSQVKALSGGMKRKLSLALALLGDPELCFLDEPSSGMDPSARRDAWDLLRRMKEGRIIVLTTHYMDEADVLGDRISIMSSGQLRCSGSPMFLKRHFGCGYNLNFELANRAKRQDVVDLVTKEIRTALAEDGGAEGAEAPARVMADSGDELVMLTDFSASKAFGRLCALLDDKDTQTRLEMRGWSIAVCHLEEVFLRVARGEGGATVTQALEGAEVKVKDGEAAPNTIGAGEEKNELGAGDVVELKPFPPRQFVSLLHKRMLYMRRDPMQCYCQLLCPSTVAILLVLAIAAALSAQPRLLLDLNVFNQATPPEEGPRTIAPMVDSLELNMTMFDKFKDGAGLLVEEVQVLRQPGGESSCSGEHDASWYMEVCEVGEDSNASIIARSMACDLLGSARSYASSRYVAALPTFAGSAAGEDLPDYAKFKGPSVMLAGNSTAFHIAPILLNFGTNLVRKVLDVPGTIRTAIHPFPITDTERARMLGDELGTLLTALLPLIILPFPIAGAAAVVIREKEAGIKTQHLLSGVSSLTYWLSNVVFDVLVSCTSSCLVIAVFAAGGAGEALGAEALLCLLVYAFAMVPFAYLVGNMFKTASAAQSVVLLMNVGVTGLLGTAAFLMRVFNLCRLPSGKWTMPLGAELTSPEFCSTTVSEVLDPILRFLPGAALWEALAGISSVRISLKSTPLAARTSEWLVECVNLRDKFIVNRWACSESAWDMYASGAPLLMLGILPVLYFTLIVLIDLLQILPSARAKLHCRAAAVPIPEGLEDSDVLEEAKSLPGPLSSACRIANVRKVYGPLVLSKLQSLCGGGRCSAACPKGVVTHAVKRANFALRRGEVFGLLGANGAGKSTIFNMLSGLLSPTEGEVHVNGEDLSTLRGLMRARTQIGYCPQDNALLEVMTTEEHLTFYARLKGVPASQVTQVVKTKMREMSLEQYAGSYAGNLSGGNKRKLMTAIALIGDPPIVLADEPSAGMDPVARRFMWSVIQRVATRQHRSAVLLSTHSMEECEALCQRSMIMVNGVCRCIGTNRAIRNRYGVGFELMAKVSRPTEADITRVLNLWEVEDSGADENVPVKVTMSYGQLRQIYAEDAYLCAALDGPCSPWAETGRSVAASPRVVAEFHLLAEAFSKLHSFVHALCGASGKAELSDWHGPMARYKLKCDKKLGELFELVEGNKDRLGVAEYSLSATTLEQVFNTFVRQQEASAADTAAAAAAAAAPAAGTAAVVGAGIGVSGVARAHAQDQSLFLELASKKVPFSLPALGPVAQPTNVVPTEPVAATVVKAEEREPRRGSDGVAP